MNAKNFFKPALAALLLAVVSGTAFAGSHASVNRYLKTNYAIVSAVIPAEEASRLAIKDADGNVLYRSSKSTETVAFQKLLDLSYLADGTYNVYAEGKESTLISTFEVKDHKLVTAKNDKAENITAYIGKNEKGLYVTQINPNAASSYLVIEDAKGETVYSSALPSTGTYKALYSINELPSGNYTVSLTSGEKTQSYEFTK